jgi:hypothetical protein
VGYFKARVLVSGLLVPFSPVSSIQQLLGVYGLYTGLKKDSLTDKQRAGWHTLTLTKAYLFLNPSPRSHGLGVTPLEESMAACRRREKKEKEKKKKGKKRKGHGRNR